MLSSPSLSDLVPAHEAAPLSGPRLATKPKAGDIHHEVDAAATANTTIQPMVMKRATIVVARPAIDIPNGCSRLRAWKKEIAASGRPTPTQSMDMNAPNIGMKANTIATIPCLTCWTWTRVEGTAQC